MKVQLKVKYLGGHPCRKKGTAATLVVDDEGVRARVLKAFFEVPWSDVTDFTVEGPEQVEKRVTVTRLLTTGIFAFALKKSSKVAYVSVGTADGEAIFEVESTPMELRAKLAWARSRVPDRGDVAPPG